ncbi:hypothetical protein [Geomicrobium sediminis]|uniref:Membrane protein YdbT with pleckstrin-like domain n=1 Tax=Geomicrobium sediminis TaxID=1347788 RepID=A0ABS2PCA1_9BACL|nr:hypothetical protein [Geomicrobium sediminis]MBM7632680.1 putative membrane protein YdbT with pleckstrin-like domain [Geomicrobium sediminis]
MNVIVSIASALCSSVIVFVLFTVFFTLNSPMVEYYFIMTEILPIFLVFVIPLHVVCLMVYTLLNNKINVLYGILIFSGISIVMGSLISLLLTGTLVGEGMLINIVYLLSGLLFFIINRWLSVKYASTQL